MKFDNKYGVKSLVMINSGTVDYLKLDLTLPLHLNAENNIGKTSTVNTLQFLYIDSMEDMYLPAPPPQSTDFYFRDEFSYLIFECTSKSGTFCVVLNRRRDSRKHYSRFVIPNAYSDDIFISKKNSTVRAWEDILEFLDQKNIETFSVPNRHWWRVLSGLTDRKNIKALPTLFILPVKDEPSYERFKTIYRNLLSMSSIKLETFKDILLSCAVAAGEKRKIDFAEKDYKLRFDKARNLQRQHEFFLENRQNILKLIEYDIELKKFRKKIPVTFAELDFSYKHYSVELAENQIDMLKRKSAVENEIDEMMKKRDALIAELTKIAILTEQNENFFVEFETLEQNPDLRIYQDSYSLEELKLYKENELDKNFHLLNERLSGIQNYDKITLDERINKLNAEKNICETIIAGDSVFLDYLINNGLSEIDITNLVTFFRDEFLTLDMHSVKIKNKDKLIKKLKALSASCSNSVFEDDSIKLNLPQIHFSLDFKDKEKTQLKLNSTVQEIDELKKKLAVIIDHEDKINELNSIISKRRHVSEIIKLYEKFEELKIIKPKKNQQVDELDARRDKTESDLENTKNILKSLNEEHETLNREIKDTEASLNLIENEFKRMIDTVSQHFPNILNDNIKFSNEVCDLDFLKEEFAIFTRKLENITADIQFVRMKKSDYLEKAGLFFDNEKDWSNFINANSDIEQARERVDKEWQTFFALAKHDFRTIVHCVDSVNSLLKTINRTFSRQQISNLAQISVTLVYQDIYEEAREFTLDSDDLFADASKRRVYLGMFQRYLSGRYTDLRAEDMFHIKIEIANPNNPAESKNITSFENESEGTNYTIKALLLSQLLKEQFKFGLYQDNIVFHYYLDEIGQLDETNLSNIVLQNLEKNLLPITAAPRPVVDPLCHPICRVVTLKEHPDSKRTFVAFENTFTAEVDE
jgi:hypothetical protein